MSMGKGEVHAEDSSPAITALVQQIESGQASQEAKDETHAMELARLSKVIEDQARAIEKNNIAKDIEAGDRVRGGASTASTKMRFAIVVELGHNETDASYVDVGVNGRVYRILRGQVVEVPPEVIGVLKNAVIGKPVPYEDEKGLAHGVTFRQARRFPFRVLGKAINEIGDRITTFEDEADIMEV